MKDCAHCTGNVHNRENTDPASQWYWHCDCWGGTMECCRCEKVADPNCTCDACMDKKKKAANA